MTITFDTGALVALERRRQRMTDILARARSREDTIVVPQVVLAEWWRGRSDWRDRILAMLVIDRLTDACAKLAGEAIARVPGATAVDAIVMASAASRGDAVFTSDVDDLERLRAHFPGVRVLSVGT
ncbi:MAG: PIN domain-containing protein [Polyangiaceae bacterium]|nr:PIN domain-containing protein [Polyangiaceae bacterium]